MANTTNSAFVSNPAHFRMKEDGKHAHLSTTSSPNPLDDADATIPERYRGTTSDKHDMMALGNRQVLRRNFKFLTMTGFASMVVCAWEGLLPLSTFVLIDEGRALLFWGFWCVATGMTLMYLSVAEIASMSPTAAGQYHWVSEFGPPKYQQLLSYCTGWLCAIGWQTFLASVCFMVGTIIQGLIILNDESYIYQAWHGTLKTIAVITFSIIFNTVLVGRLPTTEGIAVVVHILGIFSVIIPLWSSKGLSAMVGLTTPVITWIGYDCSVHMAEDIQDASRNLPRSILSAVALNGTLALLMTITLVLCLGDIDEISATTTGYPFLAVFENAVKSKAGVNAMSFLVIFGLTNCAISETAASSRQIWSFARDNGLPGSAWLQHNVPLRSVLVSWVATTLLSLINIGSTAALNAINSLAGVSLLTSYLVTISCLVWRRLYGAPLPERRWSLGKDGILVNCGAIAFLLPVWFFAFWPLATPVDAETINWAPVMLCGILVVALAYWVVRGRHVYTGPVVQMRR